MEDAVQRALISGLLLAGLGVVAGVGQQGCTPNPVCCQSDAECGFMVCAPHGQCVQPCSYDTDCLAHETCVPNPASGQNVCLPAVLERAVCAAYAGGAPSDAGAEPGDAGVEPVDAGPRDAGPRDAGPSDAGMTPRDAGMGCTDAFEPNDTRAQAAVLPHGETVDALMCPGDEDHYALLLEAGNRVRVDVLFTHDGGAGDIDVELITPAGEVALVAESGDDDEQLEWRAASTGAYLIRAYPFTTAADNTVPYRVRLRVN